MKRRFLAYTASIIVLLMGTLWSVSFVLADDGAVTSTDGAAAVTDLNQQITDKQNQIKQLQAAIDSYKATINDSENQAVSLKNELNILDNHIAEIQSQIDLTNTQIQVAQLQIDSLHITIAGKQQDIDRQQKIVSDLLRNVAQNDEKNYLDILLTYSNFSDFFNQLKYTQMVSADLGQSVKQLQLAKADLNAQEQAAQAKVASYLSLQQALGDQKSDLSDQVATKQNLLSETQSSEARYQTLLTNLKGQYQAIESQEQTAESTVRQKLQSENKIAPVEGLVFSWPVPSHYINATFHDPTYPFNNVFAHSGIDIRASQGTPVRAAADGYVAQARHCTTAACYSYILIVHTENLSSLYGHLSGILVADDQYVSRGDIIGYSGGTPGAVGSGPFVTGPHLHFEVRLDGIPVDPMGYMEQ